MEAGGTGNEMQQSSYQEPLERRRCEHTLIGGTRCRRWADRDEKMCHAHRMYAETWGRSRVDVPLLEDDASILYVLSQAAQALARGAMPPANGLAIIGACRTATRILTLRVERGKLAARSAAAEQRAVEAREEEQAEHERREETDVTPEMRESAEARPAMCEEAEMAVEVAACEEAECDGPDEHGADEDGTVEAVDGNPFEEARAAAAARAAAERVEREEREGPRVQLPRFRREDLEEQWEEGKDRPFRRNENNMFLSHNEAQAMMQWKHAHREIVNGQDQRMLDVYFGRAESRPDDPWMRC